ncbi:glycosyltransferase, partial [Vibrio vulnificus]
NIRPGGGPAGYLYNLNQLAESDGCGERLLKVESLIVSDERASPRSNELNYLKNIPLFINNLLFIFVLSYNVIKYIQASIKVRKRINTSDMLVFHDQIFAFVYKSLFRNKVSVMPHQPKELASEASELYSRKYHCSQKFVYRILSYIEFDTYKNAEFIMLPCKESIDAYFVGDDQKRQILNEKKIIEVTSSVIAPEIKGGNDFDKGSELIVGFIGRYTRDKGFDRFNELVLSFLDNNDVKFISAGSGDITPISSHNYTDLGWRSDIGDIINYCDILVVPNRVTYFDLLPIESLLLGTPVCVTNVGGNKFLLDKLNGCGVYEYDVCDLSSFTGLLKMATESTIEKEMILSIFDTQVFLENHKKAATQIIGLC